MVTVTYCPVCRGSAGGKLSSKRMTAKERSERARLAGLASAASRKKG
jgi:hypothetical protein